MAPLFVFVFVGRSIIAQGVISVEIVNSIKEDNLKVKKMSLRERFDRRGFGVNKYAKAFGLSQPVLSKVLSGDKETTGSRKTKEGTTKKVYAQLKSDGVWIGALPWECER